MVCANSEYDTSEPTWKAKACKSQDELLALAKAEGVQLNDEQLAAVSGGGLCMSTPTFTCPKCGSTNVSAYNQTGPAIVWFCTCKDCKHKWTDWLKNFF